MCTNFVIIKKRSTEVLIDRLEVDASLFRYQAHAKPGSMISIIRNTEHGNEVRDAIWWLFLRQTESGLKPHPDYFSVNTNHAKLPKRPEFKISRCIIPATAFMESQGGKNPYLLEPTDESTIAFGGLYKEWVDKVSGELVMSASIITLPGHPALENIHRKSTPLWLSEDQYEPWLNHKITQTNVFDEYLIPKLVTDITATPIDKVSQRVPNGEPIAISCAKDK